MKTILIGEVGKQVKNVKKTRYHKTKKLQHKKRNFRKKKPHAVVPVSLFIFEVSTKPCNGTKFLNSGYQQNILFISKCSCFFTTLFF